MRKRRNVDEVARLLREFDRDLAKGLTVTDICRKVGIAETTYYRIRGRVGPGDCSPRAPTDPDLRDIIRPLSQPARSEIRSGGLR
jgi:hypothetical protein